MPVQGLFVLRHLPSMSLLLPAPSCKEPLLVCCLLAEFGRHWQEIGREDGSRESIIPSPSRLAAAFPPCFSLPLGSSTRLSVGQPQHPAFLPVFWLRGGIGFLLLLIQQATICGTSCLYLVPNYEYTDLFSFPSWTLIGTLLLRLCLLWDV